ncbi:MAG: glycosyltransferase family 2 protein [Chloroflexota bacterium]
MKHFPHVAIILLNWHSYIDTSECLNSLCKSTYQNRTIIVVDNGSRDDSADQLENEFSEISLLRTGENLGFAAGNNVGITHAIEQGADYFLLLNNDTLVSPGFLEPAIDYAENSPNVGLVGGKIYFAQPSTLIWDAGGRIDWLRGHGKREGTRLIDTGLYEDVRQTTFVTGCMMLIKRSVIDRVGLLPEEYFFGVEEWDYSVQVSRAGFKLAYIPEFKIWHKVGQAHNDLSPKYVYSYMRGRMLFMRRNAPRYWYLVWLLSMRLQSYYKKHIQFPKLAPDVATDLANALDKAFLDHRLKSAITRDDLEQFA